MKSSIIFVLTISCVVNAFAQETLHRFGTVRYPDGEPAAGVHITFYPGGYYSDDDYNYHEAITDTNGWYEILPPKKVSSFGWGPDYPTNTIMARDFEKNLAAVQAFSVTTTNVDLTLQPAITLSGSVKNTEGVPVSRAEIDLGFVSAGYGPRMRPPFKANEEGQFSIPALPQGVEYWISGITAKGYGSSTAIVKAKDTQTNHCEFPTFVLKHADRILAGRVLDSDGKPVAGAEVNFRGDGQPQNSKTKTDSEGKFFTDMVCEGEVRVRAVLWGPPLMSGGGSAGTPVQAGDTNVVIRIRDPNVIAGAGPQLTTTGIVFDPSGKPALGVTFAVWRSANPFNNFFSDVNGKYKIRWQSEFTPTSRTRPNIEAVLCGRDTSRNLVVTHELDETTTNLDLHLQAGCTLTGSVLDENGRPFTNAAVSLNMSLKDAGADLAKVQPDANGSFSFNALPQEGEYRLEVKATSKSSPWWYETGDTARITGYAAATATTNFSKPSQSLQLPPFRLTLANLQVAGTVVDSDDKPVAGMRVNAWGPSQMLIANTMTDAKGHFIFNHVARGSIRVMACIAGINNNQSFVAAQGGDTNIVLKLQAP